VPTLYELLGALPQDDADGLRAAFRKAAKASHPDNNPDDADAPQRFRQIVRAHAILKDETQRAAYDQLLAEAGYQPRPEPRHTIFSELGLPGPIGSMLIASLSIGAFVALERVFAIPVAPAHVQEISTRAVALSAARPAAAPGTVGKASDKARDTTNERTTDKLPATKEPEIPRPVGAMKAPAVEATQDAVTGGNDSAVAAPADPVVKDARYYLERGTFAYHSGDFPLALTDFDLAITHDPDSSDAYVNRAIVFRRMGDLKRALADVNQAKRIDERKPP
jgi:tetratricopeptide (TPR) repeat protein